ncbi:MAG: DUF547 domain-containing protein [bacterium]|nr:DUF547 domain-containing protein [bacterium]
MQAQLSNANFSPDAQNESGSKRSGAKTTSRFQRSRLRRGGVFLMAAAFSWAVFADGAPFDRTELSAAEPDWSTYDAILKKNVARRTVAGVKGNFVNYAGIKADARWPGVVRMVANYNAAKLSTRNEKLAFYINAYNVLVIDLIVRNHPVADINKLGSDASPIWKRSVGKVAGRSMSLDGLENGIVRPFGDARIHFALNCGALSCPDLRREAYTAAKLRKQLAEQAWAFTHNASKGIRVDDATKTVHLSKIFEWFEKDFKDAETYVRRYRKKIPAGYAFKTDIEYNWRLNGR